MRVLQVVKSLDRGGAEVLVRTLSGALAAQGHEVAVAAMPGTLSDSLTVPQYALPPSGTDPRLLVASARALAGAIADFRPDVVHAHNSGMLAVAGLATRRGRRAPALTTMHGGIGAPEYRRAVRLSRLARIPLVACGPAVARHISAAGGQALATVVNGVDPRPARPTGETRRELGVADGDLLVVQVGRLVPEKNPVLAVEGYAASGLPGILAFAGAGPLRDEVADAAARCGITDRVRLLGARDDVADLMSAADVVLLTSRIEGLPLVLLEAMTLGRPVVGTRASGVIELIRDGVDGLLVDQEPSAVGAGLARLAGDPALRDSLGAAARERAAAEFSAQRMVTDYVGLYERLAGKA
ncbi:MAG: glycosyltransferase family 4 protein [Micrococcales bacterium]|nr:glycosyltransferase family 4 protein [Micrococcales bacterium]